MWAKIWGKSLDNKGMKQVAAEKAARKIPLTTLMSRPFDVDDEEQIAAIKSYVDDFQYTMNLILLMQGMRTGLVVWGASLALKYFIPVPDFVNSIITGTFYMGLSGLVLKNCSINDFQERHNEMETLYLWALKNGAKDYDGQTNNNKKLNHPEIQRLLKVIAPFSDVDLLIAWPRVAQQSSQPVSLYSVASGLLSIFSSGPEPTHKLKTLQEQIEGNKFVVNPYGFNNSLGYFTSILGPKAGALMKSGEKLLNMLNTHGDTLQAASRVSGARSKMS